MGGAAEVEEEATAHPDRSWSAVEWKGQSAVVVENRVVLMEVEVVADDLGARVQFARSL